MFVPIYYLLNTNTPISLMHCCIHNFFFCNITRKAIPGWYLQHTTTKAQSPCAPFLNMWLYSHCLIKGHTETRQANSGQDQRSSGSDLGNRDLSVNTAETKRCQGMMTLSSESEGRSPPSTSALTVKRFPCLCWLVDAWRYMYPFWHKLMIQILIFCLCMEERKPEFHQLILFITA